MNVPELRFPEFEGKWEEKKFSSVCSIEMGQSPSSKNYTENSEDMILIQGNADLKQGKVIPRIYTTQITKTSNPGDIILTVRAPVGDIAVNDYFACIGRGVCSIKGDEFIYHLLGYLNEKNIWKKLSQGSTFEAISSSDIKNLNINIPLIKEQKKIASFLSKIDEKIEKLEKKQVLWENYKKGMMQKIFSQELRFKDENGDEYPDWENKFIDNIFDIGRGEVIAKTKLKEIPDAKYCYPVYSSQTQNRGVMGYYKNFDFDGDFLTWTTDGANAGKVMHRNGKFKCSNVCGILKTKNEFEGMANVCTAEILDSITHKYVSYVGNPKLMNNVMGKIKIKIPNILEQKKIADLLIVIDSKINLIEEELGVSNEFKKGFRVLDFSCFGKLL